MPEGGSGTGTACDRSFLEQSLCRLDKQKGVERLSGRSGPRPKGLSSPDSFSDLQAPGVNILDFTLLDCRNGLIELGAGRTHLTLWHKTLRTLHSRFLQDRLHIYM